jgi:multicomponent Na+:H+ antiporter subunit E
MDYFGNETFAFRFSHKLLGFWGWLAKEIVVSSLHVTKVVLKPKIEIEPKIQAIDVSKGDALDQALLGNSITLTPGSLALDLHNNKMLVHTLTRETSESLLEGEMQRRVFALREN